VHPGLSPANTGIFPCRRLRPAIVAARLIDINRKSSADEFHAAVAVKQNCATTGMTARKGTGGLIAIATYSNRADAHRVLIGFSVCSQGIHVAASCIQRFLGCFKNAVDAFRREVRFLVVPSNQPEGNSMRSVPCR